MGIMQVQELSLGSWSYCALHGSAAVVFVVNLLSHDNGTWTKVLGCSPPSLGMRLAKTLQFRPF